MIFRILAVGTKMPEWVQSGFHEYAKRLVGTHSLELIEIPAEKRSKTSDISRLIEREGEKILGEIKPGNMVVALDVLGRVISTEQMAKQFENWQVHGRHIDFLIGGPDGLAQACLSKADVKWSLSALTLPHPLVRILLAEQVYRACSILQNHPYHR